MRITKIKFDILKHRLDTDVVGDVLAETMATNVADAQVKDVNSPAWTKVWDETQYPALVRFRGAARSLDVQIVLGHDLKIKYLPADELECLIDCVEGSTYFAGMDDAVSSKQMTKSAATAAHREADELEAEVSTFARRPVKFPR